MFSSYRALLARAGARSLALACALGWLVFAGYSLAVILAVHAASGSFSEAGGAVAAFAVGSGMGAPGRGRLIDRGGSRYLIVFAVGHAVASAALIVCCTLHVGAVLLLLAAGAAGLLAPPLIATARRAWGDVAGDLTPAAHALNGALGDVGSLLGPATAGGLAAAVSPTFGFAALSGTASASAAFVASRWGDGPLPPATGQAEGRDGQLLMACPGLLTLLLGDAAFGVAFGAMEVAVTALCARARAAELAAVPLSATAAGSVLMSLWSGTGRLSKSASWRYRSGCWMAALMLLPLVALRSIAAVSLTFAASGAGLGLLAVALYELLDEVAPEHRAVEAFTWLTTGQAAGMALGSAVAGQLTRQETGLAFALGCAAALAGSIAVSVRRKTLRPVVEPPAI